MPKYRAEVYRQVWEYQGITVEAGSLAEAVDQFEDLKEKNWDRKGECVRVDDPIIEKVVRVNEDGRQED